MGTVHVTGPEGRALGTVGSFIANLPEMLGAMAVDPRCLVAIAEFEDVRYVRFWVEPDGLVIAEVISNLNIGDAVALTPVAEDQLRAMGWCEPSPGPNPNWRVEGRDARGLLRVVAMTRFAVLDVLGEKSGNPVSLRTWAIDARRDLSLDRSREETRVYYQDRTRQVRRHLDDPSP